MKFDFVPMNKDFSNEIINWKYEEPYSFYDMTSDKEDLKEFKDEKNWENRYFAVINKKYKLVGFYSYNFEDKKMWIGFGLKPSLTGGGNGEEFVKSGIEFGIKYFDYTEKEIYLAVAKFNIRAIKLYKKIGFESIREYLQKTNGGEYEFIEMKKRLT